MRLVAMSDIHGNLVALETVLRDMDQLGGWDHLWLLGDLAAMGPRPVECLQRIKAVFDAASDEQKKHLRSIRGNTDRYLVTGMRPHSKPAESQEELDKMRAGSAIRDGALAWGLSKLGYDEYAMLKNLGGECDLWAPGYGAVIGYHGTPGDDEGSHITPTTPDEEAADALMDREGRLGIGAHIHVQMDRHLPNGWRAINIGSVGMSFDKPGYAQYGVFTFENGDVTVDLRAIPYDLDAAIEDLRASGFPSVEWMADRYRNGQK